MIYLPQSLFLNNRSALNFVFFVPLWLKMNWSLHFRRLPPVHPLQQHTNDTAADTREQSAALVSFQRQPPNIPPTQNVNSAVSRRLPACHFGGRSAICAIKKGCHSNPL